MNRNALKKSKFFNKSSIIPSIGDQDYLSKKVSSNNKKYKNITSLTNNGKNKLNSHKTVKRINEIFKRIKRTVLYNLLHPDHNVSNDSVDQLSMNNIHTEFDHINDILLLDIRSIEQYNQYHIKNSISFPLNLLKRDAFTTQILSYKNISHKIIILIAERDNLNIKLAGTLFIDKNFNNTYVLSGGIEYYAHKFPQSIVPSLPLYLKKQLKSLSAKKYKKKFKSS